MNNKFLVTAVVLILIFSPTVSSQADTVFTVDNNEPEMTTGDYFHYDLDLSGLLNSMEVDGIEKVVENSNSGMRMEYGGESCLQTGWDDCVIGLVTWEFNVTMIFSEGSGIDEDTAIAKMRMESTIVDSDRKSEDTTLSTMEMWFSIEGDQYYMETVTNEVTTTTTTSEAEPESIVNGDSWSTSETVETIVNEKSRTNGGEWEYEDEIVESENSTTNYNAEAISNVYIGNLSYKTLKIKSEELGESEMGNMYIASSGMPVKMEYYENGTLQMIATLSDYSWSLEPKPDQSSTNSDSTSEDEELPGFAFSSAIISSMFAVYIFGRNDDINR